MQAKEELLETLGETYGYVSQFVEKKIDYFKLTAAESSSKMVSGLISAIILGVLGLLTVVFALITLGFFLVEIFDSGVYGFGAVTLLLLIIFLVVFLLRRTLIVDPTVSKVITKFFEHDGKDV